MFKGIMMDDNSCSKVVYFLNTPRSPGEIEMAYRSLVDKCICAFIHPRRGLSG
jgi:hypothetical protein